MRKSAIFILTLSFLLCTQFASGQGYRGKRFTIAYQPGYSMVNPTYDFKHIIMHHKLNAGMALGKHFSINLTGSYTNSRNILTYQSYDNLQVKDITGGVTFQYFYSNFQSFAPIGRYIGLGIDYGRQNTKRSFTPTADPGVGVYTVNWYDDQVRENMFMISLHFGKNFLIREKILFGYGLQLGVCTKGAFALRHFVKPQFIIGIPL